MHQLTRKKLEKFVREFEIAGNQSEQFERYVSANYLHQYLRDDTEKIERSILGGGSDEGIDICLVVVNGTAVFEPADIGELISDSNSNTAKVVFLQAKTSESYDAKLIAKFLHGIESVTKYAMDSSSIRLPSRLVDVALLIDKIAENLDQFQENHIPCEIYFVTTSSHNPASARAELQVTEALKRICQQGVYQSTLDVQLHGHQELASKQKERYGPQNVKFHFSRKQAIPETGNVTEAFIGLLQADELLKLLLDESGEIRPGIFDDNVRLDLGAENEVNVRINDTLTSADRASFPFLNNGLTIVASTMSNLSDRFTLSSYQIVNGGQTSHQLIRWSRSAEVRTSPDLLREVWVPVKIISSDNSNVRSSIAVATNLQSPIAASDIQASSGIAQNVEEYFAHSGTTGLRYERQNRGTAIEFPRTRVVTTPDLNRAVASALFGESARAISSPKELESRDSFVWGEYPLEAYYYAARLLYRLDRHFGRSPEDTALRAAKYHLAMMASVVLNPSFADGFASENVRTTRALLERKKGLSFDAKDAQIDDIFLKVIPLARKEFEVALNEGRSLRRDDVRNRRSQENLLKATLQLPEISP